MFGESWKTGGFSRRYKSETFDEKMVEVVRLNILHVEKLAFNFQFVEPIQYHPFVLPNSKQFLGTLNLEELNPNKICQNFIRHVHQKPGNPCDLQPVRPKAFFLDPSFSHDASLTSPKTLLYPSHCGHQMFWRLGKTWINMV